jgi:ribosomal protein S18 acetylase RimI-like enzyme
MNDGEEKSELTLRLADERDVAALVEFNQAMARETEGRELVPEVITAGVRNLLRQPQYGFYVVAERAGAGEGASAGTSANAVAEADRGAETGAGAEVAGALMVTYEWSDWRNGLVWWIQSVYVKAEWRRRGVYRRLYEFVKSRAAAQGNVRGFRLYVEKQNHVAQQTYRRLGMEETYYKMFEETPDADG